MTSTARLRSCLLADIESAREVMRDNLKVGGDPERAAAAATAVRECTAALASLITASRG
jgi:glutamate/tyrosine decarboxylase-like PLP-dependent enzyme